MQRRKREGLKGASALNRSDPNNRKAKLKLTSVICAAFLVPLIGVGLLLLSTSLYAHSERNEAALERVSENAPKSPAQDNNEVKMLDSGQNSASSEVKYHIIFSTGCSTFQDWQSYVFFHGALSSGQPGTITRIVSGCGEDEEQTLGKFFAEQIEPMAPGRFKIHFTPDHSKLKPGIVYKYWNKPFGLKHWLEHVLGFPDSPVDGDSIVVLLDPDQLIIRPFTNNDFSNTAWKFLKEGKKPRTKIEHGKPMGQLYGFHLQWKEKIDMKKVTKEHSPVDDMSNGEALSGYTVGPPYIATARDMYQISLKWTEFAVPVHDQYPHLLAEMFAYCLAAAHLKLSHQIASSFMVSDIGARGLEGWDAYVDKLSEVEVCEKQDPSRYPNVIHYCQRYGLGKFFFGKYRFPNDFLSCESPLLKEPPKTLAKDHKDAVFPGGERKVWNGNLHKENAFMLCHLIPALNAAGEYYKRQQCDPKTANFNKTLTFVP